METGGRYGSAARADGRGSVAPNCFARAGRALPCRASQQRQHVAAAHQLLAHHLCARCRPFRATASGRCGWRSGGAFALFRLGLCSRVSPRSCMRYPTEGRRRATTGGVRLEAAVRPDPRTPRNASAPLWRAPRPHAPLLAEGRAAHLDRRPTRSGSRSGRSPRARFSACRRQCRGARRHLGRPRRRSQGGRRDLRSRAPTPPS